MASASKLAKLAEVTPQASDNGSTAPASPQLFLPFQTGPSLQRIPDDVLHEILFHLPALSDSHVLFGHRSLPPVISSSSLVRTPTLRALSQTSRPLRSRCLAMAWQCVELCSASMPEHITTFYRATGNQGCYTHLEYVSPLVASDSNSNRRSDAVPICGDHPRIRGLSRQPTQFDHYPSCARAFPNDDRHQERVWRQTVSRRTEVSLPCSAHEIIKSCPNVEEVTCVEGDGSRIVGSIINGNRLKVHTLKGCFTGVMKRLVKSLPSLKCVSVRMGWSMTLLTSFPHLDAIEIDILVRDVGQGGLPSEYAADMKKASEILKRSKSAAQKTVVVTKWRTIWNTNRHARDRDSELESDNSVEKIRDIIRL